MNHSLGKRLGRPFALVAALLTMALVLATPGAGVASMTAVKTPSHVVAKSDAGTMRSYVHGTASGGRRVVGSFTPSTFKVRDGRLLATGMLDVVTRGPGKDRHVEKRVTLRVKRASVANVRSFGAGSRGMPSAAALGSCDVLNLVLGPLDLNLLGLKVHLDKVVLNIVAASGAGALLGNLLCAVAGLLDSAGGLSQISALLNQILGALNL